MRIWFRKVSWLIAHRTWQFDSIIITILNALLNEWRATQNAHKIITIHIRIFTCAFERPRAAAISSRSAGDRYFWYRNRFSSSKIWWLVKAVRDFRFFFGCGREANKFRWDCSAIKLKTRWRCVNCAFSAIDSVFLRHGFWRQLYDSRWHSKSNKNVVPHNVFG